MSNATDDETVYKVDDDGMITLFETREDRHVDLDGNETTTESQVEIAEVHEDNAEDVWHALGKYLADEKTSNSGPPGQKPMHQQFAEVEPER